MKLTTIARILNRTTDILARGQYLAYINDLLNMNAITVREYLRLEREFMARQEKGE